MPEEKWCRVHVGKIFSWGEGVVGGRGRWPTVTILPAKSKLFCSMLCSVFRNTAVPVLTTARGTWYVDYHTNMAAPFSGRVWCVTSSRAKSRHPADRRCAAILHNQHLLLLLLLLKIGERRRMQAVSTPSILSTRS